MTVFDDIAAHSPGEGAPVDVVQLYAHDMNIYGDWGNVLTIVRRLQWRGFVPRVHALEPGGALPARVDIVVGGGGQDSGQGRVYRDLLERTSQIRELVDDGVPMLLVCGLYQLFGREFVTANGERLTGIEVLDVSTKGRDRRMVGNVTIDAPAIGTAPAFGTVVGFENHSGQTYLGSEATPFGTVVRGEGNNGEDGTEGARTANVIATYLHGPLLPKNPQIADWIIGTALEHRYGIDTAALQPLDDRLAAEASGVAAGRPR